MPANKTAYYLDIVEIVLLCAVAFLIPVYVWATPTILAASVLLFLVRPRNYVALKQSVRNMGFWAMLIPFVLYLIGFFYSDDKEAASQSIENSLSLLIFPFIATSFGQNAIKNKLKYVEMSFVVGVFVIMVYSIIIATINYADTHNIDTFFYTSLIKSPHHHSYYVLFALIVVTHNFVREYSQRSKLLVALDVVASIVLIAFIGLLSSKATILILAFYILYIIVRMLVSRQIPKWLSILVALLTLATAPMLYSLPMVKYRIDYMFESLQARQSGEETSRTRNESTTIRLKCFDSAIDVISENWLIGTGQGDIHTEMQKKMEERMGENYNGTNSPHNQFLRSFASFGILGILSLLVLFATMFVKAIKRKNALMVWWCIICLIFFCVEDMLCIINGIIFFCLFTGIMLMEKQWTIDNGQLTMDN